MISLYMMVILMFFAPLAAWHAIRAFAEWLADRRRPRP